MTGSHPTYTLHVSGRAGRSASSYRTFLPTLTCFRPRRPLSNMDEMLTAKQVAFPAAQAAQQCGPNISSMTHMFPAAQAAQQDCNASSSCARRFPAAQAAQQSERRSTTRRPKFPTVQAAQQLRIRSAHGACQVSGRASRSAKPASKRERSTCVFGRAGRLAKRCHSTDHQGRVSGRTGRSAN